MSVVRSVQETGAHRKEFEIEVPVAALQAETERVVDQYRSGVRLPGFRKGKVPKGLIAKRFAREIDQEVLDRLVPTVLPSGDLGERDRAARQPARREGRPRTGRVAVVRRHGRVPTDHRARRSRRPQPPRGRDRADRGGARRGARQAAPRRRRLGRGRAQRGPGRPGDGCDPRARRRRGGAARAAGGSVRGRRSQRVGGAVPRGHGSRGRSEEHLRAHGGSRQRG